MNPTIRKGTITESNVSKAGGCDLEVLVVCHHQVFHDALAGTHDIHRICRFIRTYAEEMLRRINCQQIHQLLGLDVIVLYQSLYRIPVFLRTHVLMCREVGHNIKALLFTENALKDRISKVQRIATELIRHIQSVG